MNRGNHSKRFRCLPGAIGLNLHFSYRKVFNPGFPARGFILAQTGRVED